MWCGVQRMCEIEGQKTRGGKAITVKESRGIGGEIMNRRENQRG